MADLVPLMHSDYTADGERLLLRDLSTLDGTPRSILATLRGLDNKVLREISFDGSQVAWKKDYVYRDGALLASVGAEEGIRHYHLDHLGTPRLVTNRCGERNRQLTYWPFGEEILAGVQDGTERLRFTSHERDLGLTNNTADDLDYMHARNYGPVLARMLSVDRITNRKRALRQPQNWNRYNYGLGNPLKYIDPSGLDVSIAVTFTGEWTDEDKKDILGKVEAWYKDKKVGKVRVFDAAKSRHGASWLKRGKAYADITVRSEGVATKHTPQVVFAAAFSALPHEKRLQAIANSIIHETAAHKFKATYAEGADQLYYVRRGLGSSNPEIIARYGTVADSYVWETQKTRPNMTDGPISIHPADLATLLRNVGPAVQVEDEVDF